ncbi:hypothetical protein [Streptomyces sp. NPDC050738]|uniref:hypothetical protein n=1 Tax=Streptomyces sp. NPDC050738 TaxID=3154744 RepID=UPI00341DB6E6
MAKTRITVTFEPAEESVVRDAAAEYGLDLSGFLRTAALAEAARQAHIKARFAEVDAISRSAEQAESGVAPASTPEDDAAMDTFLDAIDSGSGARGAVA